MKLEQGRPQDPAGRLEKEIKVYDFLDRLKVPYDRIDHEPAMTMEACKAVDEMLGGMICKNLFLCNRQQTDFYLLLIPGDKAFKTKELSHQIGTARLSFGSPEKMQELMDLTPGSVTLMGLLNDPDHRVRLLIDEDVFSEPTFACHPCINTSSIRFSRQDLIEKVLPALDHEPTIVRLGIPEQ